MLFVVNKKNPYFKQGTLIRKFDDGWEACAMNQEGSRAVTGEYYGIVIPLCVDMTKFALPIVRNYLNPEAVHNQRRIFIS